MWTLRRSWQSCSVSNKTIIDMDYEGFRQMVLGANIFSTKTNVLYSFSKGEEANALAANKLFDEKKTS